MSICFLYLSVENKFSQEWVAPDYWQGHMGLKTWFSSTKMSKESVLVWLDLIWGFQICKFKNPPLEHKKLWPFFLTFPHEKTTFQWPKGVSEALVPDNWGYTCVEKWSWIFVLGTESARTENFGHWKVVSSWRKVRKRTIFFKAWGEDF